MHDQVIGEIDLPGFPLKFSAFPDDLELEAPTMGEHNREILKNYLGYSGDRVEELERSGALYSKPV
jgi:crotonobetainyl-CoA:carnitine CoA-transferase CaiB-like acyl-CoA transferase